MYTIFYKISSGLECTIYDYLILHATHVVDVRKCIKTDGMKMMWRMSGMVTVYLKVMGLSCLISEEEEVASAINGLNM